ncbi:phenylalanine--tRNA ligase subunit beta [Aridibaculum aurantiacum]|uniref:phenylalanine--tRNA ligase subunit beta n=1 Tax=Aridibaculum aurantiacum TaxID=2810307 RepID=UPI001A974857|nr:phenylalanine--tRNA ligase subunit beta [Aridibaculum aurantiacum]
MTISYNWLSSYLPVAVEPQKLSKILTSIGLEVESLEQYESIKGGLEGVVVGEVETCSQHPNADKLKLTTVNVGKAEPLKIVCGASNVAAGQKVLVATIGATIHPTTGEPMTMKAAKIRGEESQGMICAEDELGLGNSHEGIIVLPSDAKPGTPASEVFPVYTDWIYEIGLTPNRMDAMSHLGVARDVCAYITIHDRTDAKPKTPFSNAFKVDNQSLPIKVTVENKDACKRYAGVSITGVTVADSPQWLKDKLVAIGQRPINNIVDITNYVLHETGQPLHAFDADAIKGNHVVVKNLEAGSGFVTLDEKERKLESEDLMICNAEEGMCIAGVFGGAHSGVTEATKNIFLESAWFNPPSIRRTSFRHGLRTEAAARFEKGVDISNTVNVLKRAALLIKEVAGGEIASDVVDVYPDPEPKTEVALKFHYLKKLSGKNYHPDSVRKILTSLGFEILKEGMDEIRVAVPFSKPDISLPADIVEEILRIDGLDNIEINGEMHFTPAIDENTAKEALREKAAAYLAGLGMSEIVTNSITNSQYYTEEQQALAVKMINSLSAELDTMRVSMLETGLETISYNINRKNTNLQFFEFGKSYSTTKVGEYREQEQLAIYLTGTIGQDSWNSKSKPIDFYQAKGIAAAVLQLVGIGTPTITVQESNNYSILLKAALKNTSLLTVGEVSQQKLKQFDIKQPVYFIEVQWKEVLDLVTKQNITYKEVSKFPAVQRDLAIVVDKALQYNSVQSVVENLKLTRLQQVQLFDIFESEKLGAGKKSMAISFTFLDAEKTMTDKEIDSMMNKIIQSFEKELLAEVRK